jgi:hypothetical protein
MSEEKKEEASNASPGAPAKEEAKETPAVSASKESSGVRRRQRDESAGPIRRLLGSSKALVVLLVIAAAFGSFWTGKATWHDIEGLLRWVLGSWLAAAGAEDAARHVSEGLRARSAPEDTVDGDRKTPAP